ncbi:hypothetical protein EAO69_25565 [Streptomyces sp. me109]|nr:hypothetical protein EAO69_25565 [Streptomyces sp. me109]
MTAAPGERERCIIHMRFVDPLAQAQMGERPGASQMHVRRLGETVRCFQRPRALASSCLFMDDRPSMPRFFASAYSWSL